MEMGYGVVASEAIAPLAPSLMGPREQDTVDALVGTAGGFVGEGMAC